MHEFCIRNLVGKDLHAIELNLVKTAFYMPKLLYVPRPSASLIVSLPFTMENRGPEKASATRTELCILEKNSSASLLGFLRLHDKKKKKTALAGGHLSLTMPKMKCASFHLFTIVSPPLSKSILCLYRGPYSVGFEINKL